MDKIIITPGKQYLTRKGHRVFINGVIDKDDVRYNEGYRFQDVQGVPYQADGSFMANGSASDQDLVGEWVGEDTMTVTETITTKTVKVEPPVESLGFFARMTRAVKRHPVATTAGVAGSAAAGYAGYNYSRYGNMTGTTLVTPGDGVEIVAALARALR